MSTIVYTNGSGAYLDAPESDSAHLKASGFYPYKAEQPKPFVPPPPGPVDYQERARGMYPAWYTSLFPRSSADHAAMAAGEDKMSDKLDAARVTFANPLRDLSSFPGRALREGIGAAADVVANTAYGPTSQYADPNDTPSEKSPTTEGTLRRAIQELFGKPVPTPKRDASIFDGIGSKFVKGLHETGGEKSSLPGGVYYDMGSAAAADPYAIPLMATGAFVPKTWGLLARGAVDVAGNVAAGATERGLSEDQEDKVLDLKRAGIDAAAGALFPAAQGIAGAFKGAAKKASGKRILAEIPKVFREEVVRQWSPSYQHDALGQFQPANLPGKSSKEMLDNILSGAGESPASVRYSDIDPNLNEYTQEAIREIGDWATKDIKALPSFIPFSQKAVRDVVEAKAAGLTKTGETISDMYNTANEIGKAIDMGTGHSWQHPFLVNAKDEINAITKRLAATDAVQKHGVDEMMLTGGAIKGVAETIQPSGLLDLMQIQKLRGAIADRAATDTRNLGKPGVADVYSDAYNALGDAMRTNIDAYAPEGYTDEIANLERIYGKESPVVEAMVKMSNAKRDALPKTIPEIMSYAGGKALGVMTRGDLPIRIFRRALAQNPKGVARFGALEEMAQGIGATKILPTLARQMTEGDFNTTRDIIAIPADKRTPAQKAWLASKLKQSFPERR